MTPILRPFGAALACLSLAALTACGSGGLPEAKIGTLDIKQYVALGDGYAAAPYTGKTTAAKGCLRSADDYPAQVAKQLHVKALVDRTCLYASTHDITDSGTPVRGHRGPVPAQLDAVTKDTDLITLTVGLSDRGLLGRLFQVCIGECPSGAVTSDELAQDLGQIGASLQQTVQDVADKAPDSRFYVVGYPQLLPRSGTCSALPAGLDQSEVDFINAALTQLNLLLQNAARNADAYFVDANALSQGHDVCSDDPWVQGARAAAGQPPAFHPKPALTKAIAAALVDKIRP